MEAFVIEILVVEVFFVGSFCDWKLLSSKSFVIECKLSFTSRGLQAGQYQDVFSLETHDLRIAYPIC